jgi:hypothetical protein
MKTLNRTLLALIESANVLELNKKDIKHAKDFFDNQEYGLAFDTIVVQMYEYEIEIDGELYNLIKMIATEMNLPIESYSFMRELIRSDSDIPQPVKEQLAKIVSSLIQE